MQLATEIRIDPKTRQLLEHFGDELRPAVIAGMEWTVQAAEAEIVKWTPVDQGTLRASIFGRTVDQWPTVQGILGSPLSYAAPVEFGSRPHWPPRAPIEAWVHRKFGLSGKEMIRVAFLVARAISRRGTRGHFMFQRGQALAASLGPRVIAAAVERVSRVLSDR